MTWENAYNDDIVVSEHEITVGHLTFSEHFRVGPVQISV